MAEASQTWRYDTWVPATPEPDAEEDPKRPPEPMPLVYDEVPIEERGGSILMEFIYYGTLSIPHERR